MSETSRPRPSVDTDDKKNVILQLNSILNNDESSCTVAPSMGKSSSEILSELFNAFNADPPSIPDTFEDELGSTPASDFVEDETIPCTRHKHSHSRPKPSSTKKHKHKHKHKSKHRPSKLKSIKSEQGSEKFTTVSCSRTIQPNKIIKLEKNSRAASPCQETVPEESRHCSITHLKKNIKLEKVVHTKKKSKTIRLTKSNRSVKQVDIDPTSSNLLGISINISNDHITELIPDVDVHLESVSSSSQGSQPVPVTCGNILTKIKLEPGTKPVETSRISNATSEGGQEKTSTKISIKSLKFSSVFEATVREVEEQAKAKADKYEEGELSNSDSEVTLSPSLSPISSIGSYEDLSHTSPNSFYNLSSLKSEESLPKRHEKGSVQKTIKKHKKHKKQSKSSFRSVSPEIPSTSRQIKQRDHRKKRSRNKDTTKHNGKRQSSLDSVQSSRKKIRASSTSPAQSIKSVISPVHFQTLKIASASGRQSVERLTNFCKRLSRKDCENHSENEADDSESERPFRHPFQVKEKSQSIVLNIRNSIQLPVKSLQEKAAEQSKQLRDQFPVSSGQRHRRIETDWVPVTLNKTKPPAEPFPSEAKPESTTSVTNKLVVPTVKDINSIVTQKLRAMRKLQENPNDVEAIGSMYQANQDMLYWAESKQSPTETPTSTVSTGASISAPTATNSVPGGMGMSLLQKMGWKPGEGLGKNREGALEPLKLEIKMDKRGLITAEDLKKPAKQLVLNRPTTTLPIKNQSAIAHNVDKPPTKHPISALTEFCNRRRWSVPQFELCHESGPDHRKNFLFRVLVNGTEYKPMVTSLSKKLAKTEAASVCLQALRDLRP